MRTSIWKSALAGLALAASAGAGAAGATRASEITGDYVEARTASVFAGACHYNGELTTTGRDAEMVWHIGSGAANGVDLAGLTAMAAVTAPDNLKDSVAGRRSVLYIDSRATEEQAKALAGMLTRSYGCALGEVVAVKRAPIAFHRTGESFDVVAKGVGNLSVAAMPNAECCKQPNLVWYEPLVAITGRKVGFTRESGIDDSTLGVSWTKLNQNTAFYGKFSVK
ncbi:MAG TPA: DUF1326 domain-containing protein [Chthonomonadaceae bacterium]|nr:DUF1326 domain-containing protein [Chthonomonadaceae bacterium]